MQPNKLAVQDLFKPEAVTNELSEYWVTIISKRWLILILTVAEMLGAHRARAVEDILCRPVFIRK